MFKNDKYNPSFVLELANKIFYETMMYNKRTNFSICAKVEGSNPLDADTTRFLL